MTRIETEEESAACQPPRIPTPAEFAVQAKAMAAAEVDTACRRIVHEMRKEAADGRMADMVIPLNRDEIKRAALIAERFRQEGWIVDLSEDGEFIEDDFLGERHLDHVVRRCALRLRMPTKDT